MVWRVCRRVGVCSVLFSWPLVRESAIMAALEGIAIATKIAQQQNTRNGRTLKVGALENWSHDRSVFLKSLPCLLSIFRSDIDNTRCGNMMMGAVNKHFHAPLSARQEMNIHAKLKSHQFDHTGAGQLRTQA